MSEPDYVRVPEAVKLPKESFGTCKRYLPKVRRKKKQPCGSKGIPSLLADGLCEYCWDRMVSNKSVGKNTQNIKPRAQKDIDSLKKVLRSVRNNV